MTKYTLALILLGLLLTPACRHRAAGSVAPRYSHEEATPVSQLPHHEFSTVTPAAHGRH